MTLYKAMLNNYGFYIQPDEIKEYTEKGYTVYAISEDDPVVVTENVAVNRTGSISFK